MVEHRYILTQRVECGPDEHLYHGTMLRSILSILLRGLSRDPADQYSQISPEVVDIILGRTPAPPKGEILGKGHGKGKGKGKGKKGDTHENEYQDMTREFLHFAALQNPYNIAGHGFRFKACLLYTSPSPRDS